MSNLEGLFCWTDEHGCICGNGCDPNPHQWYTPECSMKDECPGCMWCAGGLETCKTCGAFEGATPDHCPGVKMQPDESDAVYKGLRNFRDGQWRNECAQVMRHIYDRDNYMLEHGYMQGYDENGNPKYIKIDGD